MMTKAIKVSDDEGMVTEVIRPRGETDICIRQTFAEVCDDVVVTPEEAIKLAMALLGIVGWEAR